MLGSGVPIDQPGYGLSVPNFRPAGCHLQWRM